MARNMTTGITRRGVVKGAAAAGLVLSTTGGARAQPLRQSVTAPDFRQATLDSYKRAIANMLALPPSDPRNWYRQAMIHVLDCPHENWWFLPWHRGYILNFERICRQLSGDPDFALPYWDWTATPQLPDMFFDDVLNPAGASRKKLTCSDGAATST
jgi:tyrosinase